MSSFLKENMRRIYFFNPIIFLCMTVHASHNFLVNQATTYIKFIPSIEDALKNAALDYQSSYCAHEFFSSNLPLFDSFPGLRNKIAHVPLAFLPTPIQHLENMGARIGVEQLFIKRDDLTGGYYKYGGNKVRKLEFLLADALLHGADSVLTFGYVGSNHAVATAYYAQELGLKAFVMLKPQPNSPVVRKNLSLLCLHGACINFYPTIELRTLGAQQMVLQLALDTGRIPYVIPTGGSCPLGVIGYVNAMFELKNQIDAGEMPEPDYLYVATGSVGTAAGIILGARASGLKSCIIPVAVEPDNYYEGFAHDIARLCTQTNHLLHDLDSQFPLYEFCTADIGVEKNFCGASYGTFSDECIQAIKAMKSTENIVLDGTYTGKAFSALLAHAERGDLTQKVVLFWNTYCAHTFEDELSHVDYHQLPRCVHEYFENPTQELNAKNT